MEVRMADSDPEQNWMIVVGRSLAFLALNSAGLREKDLATQGRFLETVGLPRREAAALLGTTPASLTELLRQARARKGAKRASNKSTKRRER
jgi:hypothetical protein